MTYNSRYAIKPTQTNDWCLIELLLNLAHWSSGYSGPGDRDSIPGHVISKTLRMVLDTSLLKTQQYKVHIKDKVKQSRERSSAHPYTSV